MNYRSDIDGLRAIAVMSVIAYHSGISIFSGGYIGVDVFFVISGYLITTLIYNEITNGTFTFKNFYKRRAARLLPALSITLFFVLIFGFVFYNNQAFDNLGKELFFSSFGAVNILFAQGVNYFAKDEAYQPLIHLWSLAVEEQFYVIWPLLLLIACKPSKNIILPLAYILFLGSLAMSVSAVNEGLTKGYFLLQYRAFELLIGAITALHLQCYTVKEKTDNLNQVLSFIGIILIITPMFLFNEDSSFPGYNALWPCLGTALIIAFPNQGVLTKLLSLKAFIFIGLISYPLYLYHQPIISFIYFFNSNLTSYEIFFFVTLISTLFSWLTYKYIEIPVRRLVRPQANKQSFYILGLLCSFIPVFAILGFGIAKSNGFEERYKYLNPFALEVSQAHSASFHKTFERGYNVSSSEQSSILFVGDSVLQHYVLPMKNVLNSNIENIDTVTRGGCVLLKNVDFIDKFSDISCNEIRNQLYKTNKRYEYVVISQAWEGYDSSVRNFSKTNDKFSRWAPLINSTIEHFLTIADKVIIIGAHLSIEGTLNIQPSLTISENRLAIELRNLKVNNLDELQNSHNFFHNFEENDRVNVIEPYRIFCEDECHLHNNKWSYFSDGQHLSISSSKFVEDRLLSLMSKW